MKKVILLMCFGAMAALTSCSQYTCATYAKTGLKEQSPAAAAQHKEKITHNL